MSNKNILILTVLMSFGRLKADQPEIIRGVTIPELDLTAVSGKWFGLISTNTKMHLASSTMTLAPLTGSNFQVNVTMHKTGGSHTLVYECGLIDHLHSNIFNCHETSGKKLTAVIFYMENDSYMAMYISTTEQKVRFGNDGYILVMNRGKAISIEVVKLIEESKFNREGVAPGAKLYIKGADTCA